MLVKIMSGNQAGAVVEMRPDEAEIAITTGYGERVPEPVEAKDPEPEAESEPKKSKKKE